MESGDGDEILNEIIFRIDWESSDGPSGEPQQHHAITTLGKPLGAPPFLGVGATWYARLGF